MPNRPRIADAYRFRTGWLIAFGVTFLLAGVTVLPPFVSDQAASVIRSLYSSVCHQLPDRSPYIAGEQLAICHRCTGIYWAMPVAALIFGATRGRWPAAGRAAPLILLASVVPAGVDWLGDVLGWWSNTPATRIVTGAVFGVVAGYYLTRAIVDAVAPDPAPSSEAPPA